VTDLDHRVDIALDMARFDAGTAYNQGERATKNTSGLLTGQGSIFAAAAFVIGPFATNHDIHLGGAIGLTAFAATFLAAFVLALWNMNSAIPVRPQHHHSGWLGTLHLSRREDTKIRAYYLSRAEDPIVAFGIEAIDVGAGAHVKHLRVRLVTKLTVASLVLAIAAFVLLAAGI
jgi:hypothetical protein